jgi:hypothetical protein
VSLILFFLLSLSTYARAEVLALTNFKELALPLVEGACPKGRVFVLYSQDGEPEPLGFAEITQVDSRTGRRCLAKLISHSKSGLVRVGDRADMVDLEKAGDDIPARYDLLREGDKEVAVRHKPLVYAGYLYGHTGATLDRGEFLAGLSPLGYGISDRVMVDTTPFLYLANVGSVGVKWKFYQNEDMRLATYLRGQQFFAIGKGAWEAELILDSASNSRSMSRTKLRFRSKLPDNLVLENREREKQATVEISSVNEWMLKSWQRILFGPKVVTGDQTDLGFLLSVLFPYEHFHWSVNLEVNSLRKFDFANYRQTVSFDLFWRF